MTHVGGTLSSRFRLAGTFFEYGSDVLGNSDVRAAIIDEIRSGIQQIVKEGGRISDITVVKIFGDRVVIRDAAGTEEQLWLSFTGSGTSGQAGITNGPGGDASTKLADLDKYGGKQVGENRWVFSRERLLDYYKGLRDEPERLVTVFDSLKPLYEAGGSKIGGYRLGIEGEGDFFESAGLKEGDVVREVNSMRMTSRKRAEYLISEFIADRANAFVLDIERDGKPAKLIYEVR
jgi:type II secretory pathway component PulC